MLEWLSTGIDPTRPHELTAVVAWHARVMFFSWGVLVPIAILVARYFKILPNQNFPQELDSQAWWRFHWVGQTLAIVLTACAILMIRYWPAGYGESLYWHRTTGYVVMGLGAWQMVLGLFRGSKGGPTAPLPCGSLMGHHYAMSQRRLVFESLHKSLGYLTVLLAFATIVMGLWHVNAPKWMWLVIFPWWVVLATVFVVFQKQGRCWDTYQTIWGPDPEHPGNQRSSAGWGMRRWGGSNSQTTQRK